MSNSSGSVKIVAISGSLRKASINSGLVRAAVELANEIPGLEVDAVYIGDLPFLNTDLEVNGKYPDAVEAVRSRVSQADGVLFASPEYNYSVSGLLKTAIDWVGRPPNVWAGKPAAVVSAGGGFGGGRSGYHLRQSGVFLDLHFLNKPELFVRAFEPPAKFDAGGNLIDAATRERLKEVLIALQAWTKKIKYGA
ncbi:hypothetical protein O6H91_17G001900 [Diphasiastrum complanatum]|uniref:Uncharacterized protein n=2 Tax=Diphasiastrum complanatum TaxID=34168 RepID=A0ACC2B3P7_DIPCM|nr:hypothetical protein O6H91_17G000500 [Diphasiastrum complanatum]KAJ7524370.1 hypothetical protein O6H91_17G001900 [Diphasiastrum complanatum]